MEQWIIVMGDSTVLNNYRTLEHYEGAVKYCNGRMEQCEKIMLQFERDYNTGPW